MGVTFSPYQATQFGRRLKVEMLGNKGDPCNVFAWDKVDVNVPGTESYRPGDPWISKRRTDGRIAADIVDYVDDYRETAPTSELCWEASTSVGKCCSHHGTQDALRKRRLQSQTPGAWAGGSVITRGEVQIGVTKARWTKTKGHVRSLRVAYDEAMAPGNDGLLPVKLLESVVGYLLYISRAYPTLRVYLTEIYNTLNGWRPDRDEHGWRVYALKLERRAQRDELGDRLVDPQAPRAVKPNDGFVFSLEGLETLTACDDPPFNPARPRKGAVASYSAGDSSKAGYGSADWVVGHSTISFHFGTWTKQVSDSASNYRELLGVVLRLERLHSEGKLNSGYEHFIFTDNFVTESAHSKTTAKSRELFSLMLRIHTLELRAGIFVHVIWYAGKRMIANGIDGLSRGDFSNGVMNGKPMLDFVPIGRTVLDRSPSWRKLLESLPPSWVELTWLDPQMWFDIPFQEDGVFVWTPPPALANVALERLAEAHQIRPWNTHIMLVPGLWTAKWRKDLTKASDICVTLPFDDNNWPQSTQFEPLTLAVAFPLLSRNPWRVKRAHFLQERSLELRGLRKRNFAFAWDYLRKLWLQAWTMDPLPGSVACPLLQGSSRRPIPQGLGSARKGE